MARSVLGVDELRNDGLSFGNSPFAHAGVVGANEIFHDRLARGVEFASNAAAAHNARACDCPVASETIGLLSSSKKKTPSKDGAADPTTPMSVPVSKPAGDAAAAAPNGGAAKAAATSMVVDAFSAKVAGAIKPVLDKAAPAFAVLSQVFAIVYPYIEMAFTYLAVVWEKLQPYHPQEFMPAIAGFVLVFFGGNFFTLAAAVEAYRMVGFDDTKTALIALHKSYKVALDASKKDDEVDDDGDGIPDVKQISSKELVQRKIGVVAKAIDPELVADAVTAINAGLMAVVAT